MKLLIALMTAAALSGVPQNSRTASTTGPGRVAPSISFKDLDGAAVRLSDVKGRVVLLDFWASWCAPCEASFPALDAMAVSLQDRQFAVFAVSVDEKRKSLDAFLDAHPHRMRVVRDERMAAADAFKVIGIPTAFVIDREGRIRFSHPGYALDTVDVLRREILSLLDERPGGAGLY